MAHNETIRLNNGDSTPLKGKGVINGSYAPVAVPTTGPNNNETLEL